MNYEEMKLEQKIIAGFTARTSNSDPKMQQVVGKLWQKLFGDGSYFRIPDKCNERTIGLYSDYENGVEGSYDITVGCEVPSADSVPGEWTTKLIPAGTYAVFETCGDEKEAVGQLWAEIWKLPLPRTFTGDFEEYYPAPEGEARRIRIYVAIRHPQ